MCGIVGYFPKEQDSTVSEALLWRMVGNLLHRGPDFQDIYSQPGIGLGHTRLSIIDLDPRSNQPMVDPQSGCVIVFNGEIYNYIELRDELSALGHIFSTSSDTEVILKAYEHWGVDCLKRFNGMWAFALYDPRSRQMFAARDRFGIKPFVYGYLPNGDLVFASEAKAIATVFPEFWKPNNSLLTHFLETGNFAGFQQTFFQGLSNLLPGHFFIAKPGEVLKQHRYWIWQPLTIEPPPSDQEALEKFQWLLQDAIRLRFRSDVTVGSCLSGGLDSSTIVGLSTKIYQKQLSTFSCIYPEIPDVDESEYIDENIRHFNTNASLTTPQFPDFVAAMRKSVWEQDGPTGGPSILSQRAVMELAKGKVTVLLDGQGADEVLGGYHSFFPTSLRAYARDFRRLKSLKSLRAFHTAKKAVKARSGQELIKLSALWRKMGAIKFKKNSYNDASMLDHLHPYESDDLNTLMLEQVFTSLPNLLHYEDRNSMLYSLESRLPYLDYRLVEYAFSLPHQFKIRNSQTKWLLSETAKGLLPNKVLNRKDKMGFNTPGQVWFRQPESIAVLDNYLKGNNQLWENMPLSFRNKLTDAWTKIKAHQKVGAYAEECTLWRYFTAVMFLEQLESAPPVSELALAGSGNASK